MSWKTVPNFFPDYEDLSNNDKYNLFEGYGVGYYKTKRSGKFYKKINSEDRIENVLLYLDYDNWHLKWKLKPYFFGLFRKWVRR